MVRQRRFIAASLVFFGLVAGAWAPSAAQDSLHPGASLYGILGQVARPGVYEAPGKNLSLQELLQDRAGGLTTQASGTVRVIRQGRVVHQIYFTPSSRYDLLPGDLAVVDSFASGRQSVAIVPSQSAWAATPGATVQLAFVNLLDRPVVMKVRREHATRANIVALLRQGPRCLAAVREIRPPGTSVGDHNDPTLPSGTVLAFDSAFVDVQQLPELPPPIRREPPAESRPATVPDAAILPALPVSVAPGSLNAIMPPTPIEVPLPDESSPAGPVIAAPATKTIPALVETESAAATHAGEAEDRRPVSTPRDLTADSHAPAGEERSVRRLAMHAPWSQEGGFDEASRSAAAAGTRPPASSNIRGPQTERSPAKATSRSAFDSLRTLAYLARLVRGESPIPGQAVFAVAGIAILAAGWMLVSMARTVPQPRPPRIEPAAAAAQPLQELIANRLPIVEESPVVPEGLQFYGTPPATPVWREDVLEKQIEAPHFEIRLPATESPRRAAPEKLDIVKPVPRTTPPPNAEPSAVRMDQRHETRSPAAGRARETHAAGQSAPAIDGSRAARALERALADRDQGERS